MKGMPLPFDFEGKGVLDLVKNRARFTIEDCSPQISSYFLEKNCLLSSGFGEPTSVLDSARISSRPTSSSTLSSSHGGGGSTGGGAASTETAGLAGGSDTIPSPKWQQDSTTATSFNAPSLAIEATGGNSAMEDWENVLSESPNQEQSIFRWIMGDAEDPSMGSLNKVIQIGGGSAASEFEFSGGFGTMDQGFTGDQFSPNFLPFSNNNTRSTADKIDVHNFMNPNPNNLEPIHLHHPTTYDSKPPILNPHVLINQHPFFLPFPNAQQQEQSVFLPPLVKRHNPGGSEMSMARHQLLPHYLQQRPKIDGGDELGGPNHHQAIIDQLFKAAELIQMGNSVLAQVILARLNHHLSPIGKPFQRAAYYCKEALQMLLQTNINNNVNNSPFNLVYKIGAYKSFCEISPLVQFANFTCNQALLEVLEGFDQIHIVDFDIGYGGQWASFMQELAIRNEGAPFLKITALASDHSTVNHLELTITRENLIQFASEIGIGFEFEVISVDSLNSGSWSLSENEAVAVNLPMGCLTNHQLSLPLVLRFIKQLSPRIIVSVDRGCDRIDLPFANHIIHALQSYSNLLESLDAVNMNMDALQKIERFLLQPGLEKIVMGRVRSPEKSQHWRTQFLSSGFSPIPFSNFTESQAECVVKRTPFRGFQVEKRQSSLVLCWQRKELVSASVWRC